MQAKLKQDCKYPTLRLFFGREYNKTDWNDIPVGFENQALENEFLDVKTESEITEEIESEDTEIVSAVEPVAAIVEDVAAVSESSVTEPVQPAVTTQRTTATRSHGRGH